MVLNVTGLRKLFKGADGEPDFELTIPKLTFELGKLTYIMGSNGSGKSVLLRLMAGELRPTRGSVQISDRSRKWKAHKHPSCIVRQKAEDSLASELTVMENLLLRLHPSSMLERLFPTIKLRDRVKEILSSHNELRRKLYQPCRNLSGGQKQTLAFLAVSTNNSELLFLDEFLAATDQETTKLLLKLARNYATRIPASVLIVTHDIELALDEADRILVLKDGKLFKDLQPTGSEWDKASIKKMLAY